MIHFMLYMTTKGRNLNYVFWEIFLFLLGILFPTLDACNWGSRIGTQFSFQVVYLCKDGFSSNIPPFPMLLLPCRPGICLRLSLVLWRQLKGKGTLSCIFNCSRSTVWMSVTQHMVLIKTNIHLELLHYCQCLETMSEVKWKSSLVSGNSFGYLNLKKKKEKKRQGVDVREIAILKPVSGQCCWSCLQHNSCCKNRIWYIKPEGIEIRSQTTFL